MEGRDMPCAVTDSDGQLKVYKVKDPSMHNWMALALAVRTRRYRISRYATRALTCLIAGMICNKATVEMNT
jgi:Ni,Fe-hydrogenase III large subunit